MVAALWFIGIMLYIALGIFFMYFNESLNDEHYLLIVILVWPILLIFQTIAQIIYLFINVKKGE